MNKFLFTRFSNRDDFADWCYYKGILWMPSRGSKIGDKLGITQTVLNRAHRFDIQYQLSRFHDWLLLFQIPLLALVSIQVSNFQYFLHKFDDINTSGDLEL